MAWAGTPCGETTIATAAATRPQAVAVKARRSTMGSFLAAPHPRIAAPGAIG
jgi:hypothetical protein